MSPFIAFFIIAVYFSTLFLVAKISTKKADDSTFFIANRNAPWPLVAYGMIGVAISGITFLSVPGQVVTHQFSYFQLVIGIVVGLLIVAYVFLPVFYKIEAVSIYGYLGTRYGRLTQKTGSIYFLIAQVSTAAIKLYLMAHVLQLLIFDSLGLPFWLTVLATLLLIWLYTYRGGIKTVILTDVLQTTFLILALIMSIWTIRQSLNDPFPNMLQQMSSLGISKAFFWSWDDPKNFWKLLFTGILITVMTNGLDQSVMQKHLTCKNLSSAQKNITALAIILIIINLLFLFLGGGIKSVQCC